jgi:hypothetical protein
MTKEKTVVSVHTRRGYKKRELKKERVELITRLLTRLEDGKLPHGAQAEVAKIMDVNRSTVNHLWKQVSKYVQNGRIQDWKHVESKSCLRNCFTKYVPDLLKEAIEEVPIHMRKNMRAVAAQVEVPLSTLLRYKDSNGNPLICRKASTVKPVMSMENRTKRVLFALDQIDHTHRSHHFKDFHNTVYIDEKWFRCTKPKFHYYMTEDERPPDRQAVSKRKIEKVMFLCAVTRPRYDPHTKESFDGKIGIWPMSKLKREKHDSKNRKKGTLEVKDVSVTGKVYMHYILYYVLPAIAKNAPPSMKRQPIFLQQDNASAHLCVTASSRKIQLKCKQLGITVIPVFQPPNSPDCNILDLCFFNSLQSDCFLSSISNNKPELIAHVKKRFDEYAPEKLERGFLTFQNVLNEILRTDGSNCYDLPHMGKDKVKKCEGHLPTRIKAWDYLEVVDTDYDSDDVAELEFEAQTYDGEIQRVDDDSIISLDALELDDDDDLNNYDDDSTITEDNSDSSTITDTSFDYQGLL